MTRRAVAWLDERLGTSPRLRRALAYVFPDHWSFLLGEIALYAFIVLVGTGIFLTLFYDASRETVNYTGHYEALRHIQMSKAYESVVNISFDVPAGLLIRQTHHWAANVFVAAIVLHLMRIFFTGAYRKPRDLNYFVGLLMLMLAIVEGYAGYSLADDLLSGMGLAIGYSVAQSIPGIGAQVAYLIWGSAYPGAPEFLSRLEIVHVLLIPLLLIGLISLHLWTIVRQHHSQFPGPGRKQLNTVGTPLWPGYALRSIGLMLAVAAVLFLLGGLVQINPIWEWGPYETYLSTNGAQPDWYVGWLIGALRLMPAFEPHIAGKTIVPNPFWGGVLFPLAVFGFLFSWPALERRRTGDRRRHDLLDRPRDNPTRTAIGLAVLTWVYFTFFAGSMDRIFYRLDIDYEGQIWFGRVAAWVLPVIVFFLARWVCRALKASETHPLRDWDGSVVQRTSGGGFVAVDHSPEGPGTSGGYRSATDPELRPQEPAAKPPSG